jgi:DNA polymerase III subunit delta
MAKADVIHAFDFFSVTLPQPLPATVVCFGADDFLRRTAIHHLLEQAGLQSESVRSFDGDEAQWRDVHDQLVTRSLFDDLGGRAAIVRFSDKFITRSRESLEKWVEGTHADSILVLDVQTFPANTKLYNSVNKRGLLVKCTPPQKASWGNPPDDKAIAKWVVDWGKSRHGLDLTAKQSQLVVERIGGVCGLIDCELAKLALFVDSKGKVDDDRVHELVGGWRCQTAWEVADAIAEGKISIALEQIEKLTHAGQTAVGLTAQVGWSLRRYGVAAQIVEQSERAGEKVSLGTALERAGFNRFDLPKAESRLKRIGRERAKRLINDLVQLEMQMKGSHSNEHRARFALESLVFSLA